MFIRSKTGRCYAIVKKNRRIYRHSLKTKIREVVNARLFDFLLTLGAAPARVASIREIPERTHLFRWRSSLTARKHPPFSASINNALYRP